MKKITSVSELKEAIKFLEIKRANDAKLVKEQFNILHENLKPVNVMKNAFNSLIHMPDFKQGILNTTLGLTTSHLAKKIIIGKTGGPLKHLFGIVMQIAIANLVTKNATGIKAAGTSLLKHFLNRRKEKQRERKEHFMSFI